MNRHSLAKNTPIVFSPAAKQTPSPKKRRTITNFFRLPTAKKDAAHIKTGGGKPHHAYASW